MNNCKIALDRQTHDRITKYAAKHRVEDTLPGDEMLDAMRASHRASRKARQPQKGNVIPFRVAASA